MIQPPRLPKPLPASRLAQLVDRTEVTACSLAGGDFTGHAATEVLFEQTVLRRVNFSQTTLGRVHLIDLRAEGCEFTGSVWETPRLRRVEFAGCRLSGAQWSSPQLDDVCFKDCILEGAIWTKATCRGVRFEKCILRGALLEDSDLSGMVFFKCDLAQASLRDSLLHETDLRTSSLNGMQVNPKDIRGAIIAPAQAVQVVSLLGVTVREIEEPF